MHVLQGYLKHWVVQKKTCFFLSFFLKEKNKKKTLPEIAISVIVDQMSSKPGSNVFCFLLTFVFFFT